MTTIILYLLVQFNIGTSVEIPADSTSQSGNPSGYVQCNDTGAGSWGDGD